MSHFCHVASQSDTANSCREHQKRKCDGKRICHHQSNDENQEASFDNNDDINVKLYYFDTRGRAELIRFILKFAQQPFEDIRFTKEEWMKAKKDFPARQVPALEIQKAGEKVVLTQSLAIARHLASRFNLAGNNSIQSAQCDEVVDCLNDLVNLAVLAFLEQDCYRKKLVKARLRCEEYPRVLNFLEERIARNGGKHIVGNKWTYADLAIGCFMGGLYARGADIEQIQLRYPRICRLWRRVEDIPEIKRWIATRPASDV